MRRFPAQLDGISTRKVMRVMSIDGLAAAWDPNLGFLVKIQNENDLNSLMRFASQGLTNILPVMPVSMFSKHFPSAIKIADLEMLQCNDVVVSNPARDEIQVLFREDDTHHALFLTNRCNSLCLMCSQPPTRHDDTWLVDEAIQVVRHIAESPRVIGLTGGEPLLLGSKLRALLETIRNYHPGCLVELLTNGRLLADSALANQLLANLNMQVSWLVPLYGHADFLHDFVVQSHGAFEETLEGVLNLQAHRQAIQLRVVLIEPVLKQLPELCAFVSRNLPFVREVALMGCEPIGFALANREVCEVDLASWHDQLEKAVYALNRGGISCVLMNTPLCTLPASLWPFARRSISDWKQVHVGECNSCTVKNRCAGLFAWHERGWRPGKITPIKEVFSL